jgi:hypothetical protein
MDSRNNVVITGTIPILNFFFTSLISNTVKNLEKK